jgi:hypothetical protein
LHGVPRQGRIDPILFEVIALTLTRRFRLRTQDRAVFDALRYLECAPDIDGAVLQDVVISIEPFRGRLRIVTDGTVIKEVINAQEATEVLHKYLFAASIGERPSASVLHCACLRRNGRRVLLVGPKEAGKSTLALGLIQAGYELEGDEHVFIERSDVVARPRGCRVREGSLALLPEMADAIAQAPYYLDLASERIFNVDPRTLGSSWRIERGKADAVFALTPNHGGYSSVRPMGPSALVQFLIPETGWRDSDRGISIANLAVLASQTKAFDLSLGDHPTAIRCIELAANC